MLEIPIMEKREQNKQGGRGPSLSLGKKNHPQYKKEREKTYRRQEFAAGKLLKKFSETTEPAQTLGLRIEYRSYWRSKSSRKQAAIQNVKKDHSLEGIVHTAHQKENGTVAKKRKKDHGLDKSIQSHPEGENNHARLGGGGGGGGQK